MLIIFKHGTSTISVYIIGVFLAIALVGVASEDALTGEVSRQLKSRNLGSVARADQATIDVYTVDMALSRLSYFYARGELLRVDREDGTIVQQLGGIYGFKRSPVQKESLRIAGNGVAYGRLEQRIRNAMGRTDLRLMVVHGGGTPAETLLVNAKE